MKDNFFQKPIVVWACALICCALWGSAFPSVKTGYLLFGINTADTASLLLFAGMRFTLAGILAMLIGCITSHRLLLPKKGSFHMILPLSLLQTVCQYVFFYIALANSTGVRSSILNGVNVFVAILIASLLSRQETLTTGKIIGSLIGFAGLVLVCLNQGSFTFSFTLKGDAFMLFSAVSYAFSSVLLKRFSAKENPIVLSGCQFIIGGIILMIIGGAFGGKIGQFPPAAFGLLLYLACISAVAYSLWGVLLKYNHVSRVTVFGFMNQIFGVAFSAAFLGEGSVLNPHYLLSLALVCTGIFIVNKEKG